MKHFEIDGRKIAEAMELKGWSADELKRRSGAGRHQVTKALRGDPSLRQSTLRKVLAPLGLEVADVATRRAG